MFLRRVVTSALVVAILSLVGFCGNSIVLTKDRTALAYNSQNLIRLHIVANSDAAVDQHVKLQVRDALLARTRALFVGVRDPDTALRLVAAERNALAALAAETCGRAGASYGARVEMGRFLFPARSYPFGTLPAGEYQALRIVLGRGEGHNWWCVLFPPLCYVTPDEVRQPGPMRVRLLLLEEMLRQNGQVLDDFWRAWAQLWSVTAGGGA